jgi:glycosyltransferase involved in cell wall biosynthesis
LRRIAALVPNVLGTAPGQRVRIETWARHLAPYGWTVDFYPFEDAGLRAVLYGPGQVRAKLAGMLRCYAKQMRVLLSRPPCDLVLIYREAALIGPALLERLALRLRVPIVYDLDDPVFLPYRSPSNGWFSLLKASRKTASIMKLSDEIISINDLIADYARRFNDSVTVVPNFLELQENDPPPTLPVAGEPVRLVWTGSLSSMQNLRGIAAPLRDVAARHRIVLRVIGAGSVDFPGVDLDVRQWSPETEMSDLRDCGIGLLPLIDLPWNHWKFFLKAVQYMAAGLPVVAQRMGSNPSVIEHGVTGFIVETEREWRERIEQLVLDPALRARLGQAARRVAVQHYSVEQQMPRVASVFERALSGARRRSGASYESPDVSGRRGAVPAAGDR